MCFVRFKQGNGAKVIPMQDRPVPDENASSKIRMWVRGATG